MSNSAEPKKGANGQTYWTVVFSIEIHFGLTEFKARMKWNEDVSISNAFNIASQLSDLNSRRERRSTDPQRLYSMRKVFVAMRTTTRTLLLELTTLWECRLVVLTAHCSIICLASLQRLLVARVTGNETETEACTGNTLTTRQHHHSQVLV